MFEAIMKAPSAPAPMERARAVHSEEAHQRQASREWASEETKAEFINEEILPHFPAERKHRIAPEFSFQLLNIFARPKHLGEARHEKATIGLARYGHEPDMCFLSNKKKAAFHDETMGRPALLPAL